jgi:serine/threonine protein kinase
MQAAMPMDRLAGTMLGDYQIERLLNHGKQGTAYIAKSRGQGQPVMVTIFSLPETLPDPIRQAFWARFSQESQKLVSLRHPQLLPLHTYGEYAGYPYLVSSFMKGRSLAQIIKQQPRFTPQQTLLILKQVAVGLDYMHKNQVIHGSLNSTSILVDDAQAVTLAGIGLRSLLERFGLEQRNHPHAHLYSITGTFLGTPEYLAPEYAQGNPVDTRADIYSLGVILFEMLTGTYPFSGQDAVEVVQKSLRQSALPLQSLRSDLPVGLNQVVQQALAPNPAQRFRTAGELAEAFTHAWQTAQLNQQPQKGAQPYAGRGAEMTLPPTVNWSEEALTDALTSASLGQGIPPATMGNLTSIEPPSTGRIPARQYQMPEQYTTSAKQAAMRQQQQAPEVIGEDPFARWSATSAKMETQQPEKRTQNKKAASAPAKGQKKQKPANPDRRKVIATVASGGAIAAGAIAFGALKYMNLLPLPGQATQAGSMSNTQKTQTASTSNTPGKTTTKSGQQGTKSSQATTQQGTKSAQTTAKSAQPPAAQHTGTVIGNTTTLALNSAKSFTNPADGSQSLLIHLPNGQFVAAEGACTHEGVQVKYHPDTHTLICPLHQAVFDPANNFKVLQPPAPTPLKAVPIHVNNDGTITV